MLISIVNITSIWVVIYGKLVYMIYVIQYFNVYDVFSQTKKKTNYKIEYLEEEKNFLNLQESCSISSNCSKI